MGTGLANLCYTVGLLNPIPANSPGVEGHPWEPDATGKPADLIPIPANSPGAEGNCAELNSLFAYRAFKGYNCGADSHTTGAT